MLNGMHALWISGCLAEAATLATIIAKGKIRQWPTLVTYCVLSLLADAAISQTRPLGWGYFITYWIWAAMASVLRLLILGEVVSSIPGIRLVSAELRRTVLVFAIVLAAGTGLLCCFHTPYALALPNSVVVLDRGIAITSSVFFVVVLGVVRVMGLGWDRIGSLVACGLSVKLGGMIWGTHLITSASTQHHNAGLYLVSTASLLCALLWLFAFVGPDMTREFLARSSDTFLLNRKDKARTHELRSNSRTRRAPCSFVRRDASQASTP